MARPKSLGSYAKLSSSYFHDDAILEAGERAETLYVRGLAYCSDSKSDGFISDRQLRAVIGVGMRDVTKRATVLVNVGLWLRVDGGYVIRSWLKWHKSAEEIGQYLKADRERKARKLPGIQADSERIPDGIQADSAPQSSQETVQSSEVQTPPAAPRRPAATRPAKVEAAPLDIDIQKPPQKQAHPIGVLIGAYTDVVKAQGGEMLPKRKDAVAGHAKRLIEAGVPTDKLLGAFQRAAREGHLDFDRMLAAPKPAMAGASRGSVRVASGHSDHWAAGGGFYTDTTKGERSA